LFISIVLSSYQQKIPINVDLDQKKMDVLTAAKKKHREK
jgi:hypothetical protein